MKKVMFVCKKNSRRSQMAEGFARTLGEGKIAASSSGLETSYVDPTTIQVMSEIGIDICNQTSKPLSDFKADDYRTYAPSVRNPVSSFVFGCETDDFW
ncbi:MAG: hypothetical protein KME30_06635 [Iphinoe sp. HA4291-MV1]|jgi:glutathione/glutaredoxin type arsenate reductase|nr:hypothetical protein [Iphinoe sp. HA4291-MV1]